MEVLEGKGAESGIGRDEKTMAKRGESLRGQREDWTRSRGRRQEKATFGFKPWERGDLLLARTGERSL